MKIKFNQHLNILIGITVILLIIAVTLSINVDELGVAIGIMFPFSFLIFVVLTLGIVKGIKNKAAVPKWYLKCLIILGLGVFLWSPLLNISRKSLDQH